MSKSTKWYRFGSVVVAIGVLVVSSWPMLSFSNFGWSIEDKLQHTLVYAILAYLAYRGWVPVGTAGNRRGAKWLILLILACFAAADEYHQRWIPGRFVEWGDFLADGIGVLVGFVLGAWRNRSRQMGVAAESPSQSGDRSATEHPTRIDPSSH